METILCAKRHVNRLGARFCILCGDPIPEQDAFNALRERPGLLVLTDGSTIVLDRDFVAGREPEVAPDVRAGEASPLLVRDPELKVSRAHARFGPVQGTMTVTDLGSANGTYLERPDGAGWARLAPHEPTPVEPGQRIRLGGHVLYYRQPPEPSR